MSLQFQKLVAKLSNKAPKVEHLEVIYYAQKI